SPSRSARSGSSARRLPPAPDMDAATGNADLTQPRNSPSGVRHAVCYFIERHLSLWDGDARGGLTERLLAGGDGGAARDVQGRRAPLRLRAPAARSGAVLVCRARSGPARSGQAHREPLDAVQALAGAARGPRGAQGGARRPELAELPPLPHAERVRRAL